jgi:hypothetical protein
MPRRQSIPRVRSIRWKVEPRGWLDLLERDRVSTAIMQSGGQVWVSDNQHTTNRDRSPFWHISWPKEAQQ